MWMRQRCGKSYYDRSCSNNEQAETLTTNSSRSSQGFCVIALVVGSTPAILL